MRVMKSFTAYSLIVCLALSLTNCATSRETTAAISTSSPAVTIVARGETVPVGTKNDDAADDPAIWRNTANPSASLIIGTDKKAGLYVYDLNGKILSFTNAGNVNNVDLRDAVNINGRPSVLVVASDRNDLASSKLALFALDTATGQLRTLGKVLSGAGEAYGICLSRDATGLYAFAVIKGGTINQVKLEVSGVTPLGQIVRTMKLATQSEGCVVDERTGRLFVAEEDFGLWRFDSAATGSTTPTKIANADGQNIVADAEGVALAEDPKAGNFVIVSSQGDNAYSVYRVDDDSYVGRFRIGAGRIGATEETDGIELIVGDFGPAYPGGLFIAQDGVNPAGAQNFKLVAWDDIKSALGLQR
jgi:3-phytase